MRPDPIRDKVALVTGASSGIGLSIARKLADAGARVALVARTEDALERAVLRIGPGGAAAFPCDLGQAEAVAALPGRVVARFGRLDLLVNNAGVNHRGPLAGASLAHLAEIIATNLTAPVLLTRASLPHLPDGAAIVNVASLAGIFPVPGSAAYSGAKAGLRAFARAAAGDLRGRRISVSTVCPGPVDTRVFDDLASVPDLAFSQPMRSPDEVADAVLACIRHRRAEVSLPALSGTLAKVALVFPAIGELLRPIMERRGAAAKRRFIAARALRSR